MASFKIIGNQNPEVGKKYTYSINMDALPYGNLPLKNTQSQSQFLKEIHWSIYILEYGKWQLKEKNNKVGAEAEYTFYEISLKREGVRIVAELGGEKATLEIKPQKSVERKIINIELCDALGKLQKTPFAYNQTILARVHCLNLDYCNVHVTLWEDDASGKGHSEINKNNKVTTLSAVVQNGIAEVKFRLSPDFAKIANAQFAKRAKDEGKTHEYYVTAEIFRQETKSSNNIDVINPDYKDGASTPVKNPAPKTAPAKKTIPAESKGKSQKENKGIAKPSENKIHDWWETVVSVFPTTLPDPIEIIDSVMKVLSGDKEVKKDEKGVCPNCDKAVTVAELKQIFTKADDVTLKKVADTYTKYMKDFGMDTCWNKAHFFAQAVVESGLKLHVKGGESFNWYYQSLIDTFGKFQTIEGREKAKKWGREIQNRNDPKAVDVTPENEKNIANWAYMPDYKTGKELGNKGGNDGWDFRGKGLIQLTGRGAYEYANLYTLKVGSDIVKDPDLVVKDVATAVVSSMAFWKWKNISNISNGNSLTEKISIKVGKKVRNNYTDKQNAFNDYTSKIFKINECKWGKKTNAIINKLSTYDNEYSADSKVAYIDIIVPNDRRNQGLLVFFDDKEVLFKCYVLAMGTTNNAIMIPEGHGSTPKGQWNSWYEKVHIGESSYGNHGLIKVTGISGDALIATKRGRSGIAIHSGHTHKQGQTINDNSYLEFTYGCMRVYNADMKNLVEKYNKLKNSGKKINVYVEEVNNINNVYKEYGFKIDPKDVKRNYSKDAKQ